MHGRDSLEGQPLTANQNLCVRCYIWDYIKYLPNLQSPPTIFRMDPPWQELDHDSLRHTVPDWGQQQNPAPFKVKVCLLQSRSVSRQ